MKFNKWTLGLAAIGVVSLASAARADEKMNSLQTALSNTTISGYVSASANWAIAPGGGNNESSPAGSIPFQGQYPNGTPSKQDGINLDVVKLSISKPEDESPWASGYQVDLLFGPDAVNYNASANAVGGQSQAHFTGENGSDFAIKQAYITLRTPVGNGIDWKIGVFDSPIGYEVFDAGSDPNYTRSIGYSVEPTEFTGVLGTYKLNDQWSFSLGMANTLSAGINARDNQSGFNNGAGSDWHKTLLSSVTYSAPSSWGWAAGSSIYAGVVYGFNTGSGNTGYQGGYQQNYYLGATMNTPWKQLTSGFAFDYVRNNGGGDEAGGVDGFRDEQDTYVIGLYATYKATDKLSLNGRAEYVHSDFNDSGTDAAFSGHGDGYEVTGTVEYDLWANVITRVEMRYDHDNTYNGSGEHVDSLGLYANVIYKF
ncbi:MAG TPA: outer membrane beta-barrel protein [Verrucomicrobiae bacterium]|nr:outer membrane beta-barrel protein [Verrucomicrobiae bacterium]